MIAEQEYKHIGFVSFSKLYNWSVKYLLENRFSYNKKFPMIKMSKFLTRNKTLIEIKNEIEYKRVTIKINNGGVLLRDIERGENIGTKNQFLIKERQFLLSKIDARNGAFGVVTKELDGAIITGNFWTFDVDYNQINPFYLSLVATTPEFIEFCQASSTGTTNRHYLQEDLFLNVEIPLPPISIQEELISNYNKRILKAIEADKKVKQTEAQIEPFLMKELGMSQPLKNTMRKGLSFIKFSELQRWSTSYIFRNHGYSFNNLKFQVENLRKLLLFFESGKTPSKSRSEFWEGQINWTSPKDFSDIYLDSSIDKITDLAIKKAKIKVYPPGTLIAVFRSGILRHSFPIALMRSKSAINQDLKAFDVDPSIINKEYLLWYLKAMQKMVLERAVKFGVTVESVNSDEFLRIPIVCPPLAFQANIVKKINEMRNSINDFNSQSLQFRKDAIIYFEKEIFA